MRRSISLNKQNRRCGVKIWAVAFWLIVWQLGAMALKQEILLVSPVSVLSKWIEFLAQADFWSRVGFSSLRIAMGLMGGMVVGALLGALAWRFAWVGELCQPLVSVTRAIPVASFIILALIWMGENRLSAFIAFLICFPVFYTNVLSGARAVDPQLTEMARVFRLSPAKRLWTIVLPAVLPYFRAAVNVSVGLAWKSGIAAEVIAIPRGSIGDRMYGAKIYLETPELLAWTLTVVLLSLLFEKALKLLIAALSRAMERG